MIGFDLETHLITDDQRYPKPVCISVSAPGSEAFVSRDVPGVFSRLLDESDTPLVGHNIGPFDLGCLVTHYPALSPRIHEALAADRFRDTLLWAKLETIADGGSTLGKWDLGTVLKRYGAPFEVDKSSEWRTQYSTLENIDVRDWPEAARRYAIDDARAVEYLARVIRDVPDVARKTEQHYWLGRMTARGITTDLAAAEEYEHELVREAGELFDALYRAGIVRIDGTKDLARVKELLPPDGPRTLPSVSHPTGQLKTDADTCRDSGVDILLAFAEYSKIVSNISRELPIVKRGIVRTRIGMADSGRTTSSDPNLQNIGARSGARKCFIARPGYTFVICDYGQLELCCLGQLCVALRCGNTLATALRNGVDVHNLLGEKLSQPDPKLRRLLSKNANFGFGGKMGPKAFVKIANHRDVKISLSEATAIRNAWIQTWPDCARYLQVVPELLDSRGGRIDHYRSGRLRGGLSYTQGCNTLFQGLGADVTLSAFTALSRQDLIPSLFVHDEYLVEVPIEYAPEYAEHIADVLNAVSADWLPECPSRTKPVISPYWTKD